MCATKWIRERIIRIEEEIKQQRKPMVQAWLCTDGEAPGTEKRLEGNEKRLEANEMAVNHLRRRMKILRADMNKGFYTLTRRIDRVMVWSFSITVTLAGIVIVILRS